MIMSKKNKKMMAFALVFAYLLGACAVATVSSEDTEAVNYTGPYTIYMKTGDTFSYTPTTNLSASYTWATSGISGSVTAAMCTLTNGAQGTGKMTFSPTAAGKITVTCTASKTTGTRTQTKTQQLNFIVVTPITFASTGATVSGNTATASLNTGTGEHTYTFTTTGGIETGGSNTTSFGNPTVTASNGGTASKVTASKNGATVTVSVASDVTAGTYTVTMPASFSKGTGSDKVKALSANKTLTFTLTVYSVVSISTTSADAIIGETENVTVAITDDDGLTNKSFSLGARSTTDATLSASGFLTDANWAISSNGVITIPTGYSNSNLASGNSSAPVTFNVTVSGTQNGGAASDTKQFTLTLYRSLAFTTTPVTDAEYTALISSSANGLDVLMGLSVVGAQKITYDWGDGTYTVRNDVIPDSIYQTASHSYEKSGSNFITITSENDFGSSTHTTMYTTGDLEEAATLSVSSIKADSHDGVLTLRPLVSTSGEPEYVWTYSTNGGAEKIITDSSAASWVKEVNGQILSLFEDQIPYNTKFTCNATLTTGSEPITSSASYVYDNGDFFDEHGWLWIIFLILFVLLVLAFLFVTGFDPIVIIGIVVVGALAVGLFICKDFGGIWDALTNTKI